jgi:hypothetical protein
MGDNATTQFLEAVVAHMELLGGAIALADNDATVNCLVVPVGRIPGTRLGDINPVSIGDASEIRIDSTDMYCVELGGTDGSASYDYMFRGGLYPNPDKAIGNVISETILHSLLEMHSTPGMGRYYSLPGAEPLLPILAPNKCSYLTIKPLGGARAAALHAKAVREGLDTRSIHFGVITPAPLDAEYLLQEREDSMELRAFAASLGMWKEAMPHCVPPGGGAPVLDKDTDMAVDASIACQVAEMKDLLAGRRAAKFARTLPPAPLIPATLLTGIESDDDMIDVAVIPLASPLPLAHYIREMAGMEGGLAVIDSDCTFSFLTKPIGKIDGTHLESVVPVAVRDASTLRFPGTDLYCASMGGQGMATYDVLFRAGTYPDGMDDVSSLSQLMLRSVFNVRFTPGEGISYDIHGHQPLTPIVAPDFTTHVTLMPISDWRVTELFNVAAALKLDHDDVHFICVLEAPKIIQIAEYLSAAPYTSDLTQPAPEEIDVTHWFLRSPRADFEHWFQSAHHYV